MNWNQTLRRHFLQGAGKTALTLPFLPSLLSRRAQAQAAATGRQKSFIAIPMYNHTDMQVNANAAEAQTKPSVYMPSFINMKATAIAGKHTINSKSLIDAKNDNPKGEISTLIDPAFNAMLPKMNFLNGFDMLYHWGHHSGMFGNGNSTADTAVSGKNPAMVNIDQVMAYSTNFYKNAALKGKWLHYTGNYRDSSRSGFTDYYGSTYTYKNVINSAADQQSSPVIVTNPSYKPAALWDKYFLNFMPPAAGAPPVDRRKTLVDAVISDYRSVLNGPKLGKDDRLKVAQHVQLLQDTQKSVMATAMCSKPARSVNQPDPPSPAQIKATYLAHNDLITSLIACGMVHSFMANPLSFMKDESDAWHQWSHKSDATSVSLVHQQMNGIVKFLGLDLAAKLDAQGLLDDSLIAIISEHGRAGHIAVGANAITFGSAGGAIKTGQYIDYRDMATGTDLGDTGTTRSGFPHNQLLANLLMAADVPKTEFEPLNKTSSTLVLGKSGYGSNIPRDTYPDTYTSKFRGYDMSTWLPLLQAV